MIKKLIGMLPKKKEKADMADASQYPMNLVIPVSTPEESQTIERLIKFASTANEFLLKSYYTNHNKALEARLIINSQEVMKGTIEQVKEAYALQVNTSPRANVIMQEWRKPVLSNEPARYVTISSRLVHIVK